MIPRLTLAGILVAILLASCGGRPGLTVTIDGQPVPMAFASSTERTACSASHGDAFPQSVPLTTFRGRSGPIIRFAAGAGATAIRGAIVDLDASSPRGPVEEFMVPGRTGTYEMRKLEIGRTYEVIVNVEWSFVVTNGEETHVFRIRVEPP